MHKPVLLIIVLTMLAAAPLFATAVPANVIGVKKGDWMQYQVTITGNPPAIYENVKSARMEVTGVQDDVINLSLLTKYLNGTLYPENISLNLATGDIGDSYFVYTNLKPGDQIPTVYEGNITITSVEQKQVAAGAVRTVITGVSPNTTYYWDKQTGMVIYASTKYPDYTLDTKTSSTNIWQPQILGLDLTVFYTIVTAISAVLVIVLLIMVWRKKKT